MEASQAERPIETLHGLVDRLEEGDEFEVYAGEFIVDEVIECEARPMVRIRKKSVGGWMDRTYRLEWEDPTDEDDETLVIKTKYKSHWSEWSTFSPDTVELEDELAEVTAKDEENEPVLVTDGGVDTSGEGTERNDAIIFGNWVGDGCPVCGESVNAVLGPKNSITKPDEGEWCFEDGRFYIHGMMVWEGQPEGTETERGEA